MKGTTFHFGSFTREIWVFLFHKTVDESHGRLTEESLTCDFRFVFMMAILTAELTSDRHNI